MSNGQQLIQIHEGAILLDVRMKYFWAELSE